MNKIPFFSFERRNQDIRNDAIETFTHFFDSAWYVLGNYTNQFEKDYAQFNRTKYAVGVSTGLDALHLSLVALGIGPGDEVIVPSNTYIATVLSITYVGATPVFVEPRIATSNLDPDRIETAITSRTKCIMPVHLYGQSCEMDQIMDIAKKHNLYVVEDNAQSQGATYNAQLTGSFGDINATSFYPTKNIGAVGEAGAITTDNEELANKIKILRNYGSQETYFNEVIGYNDRLDEYEAAFLSKSLNYFEKWTKERREIDAFYKEQLSEIDEITINAVADGATTVNHLFTIRSYKRDELQKYMAENGVGTKIHYPVPPHLQECYQHLGHSEGDYPIAEELAKTTLSLPNYLGLTVDQIMYVKEMIKSFYTGR